jgi:hypothetical protein
MDTPNCLWVKILIRLQLFNNNSNTSDSVSLASAKLAISLQKVTLSCKWSNAVKILAFLDFLLVWPWLEGLGLGLGLGKKIEGLCLGLSLEGQGLGYGLGLLLWGLDNKTGKGDKSRY